MKILMGMFTLLSILLPSFPAAAQNVEVIGKYDNWVAYSFKEKSGIACYVASTPRKSEGKYTRRGDVFAIVTHRPAEKSFDVVSFNAGYDYKPKSRVSVKIKGMEYKLFTHTDTAWTSNQTMDKDLVNSMIKGKRMIVEGVSKRGTKTKDSYSLVGFTNAYKAINRVCKR
jgi:predicted porin